MGFQSLIPSGLVCQGPWKTILFPAWSLCFDQFFFMVELEIGREVMRLRGLGLVLLFPMCLITGLLMLTVQRTEVFLHLTLLPDTVANRRSSRSPFLPRCDLFRVRRAVQNTWMQMRLFGPPG